nr:hypothetical protein [Tanacetum cinerariifolium]
VSTAMVFVSTAFNTTLTLKITCSCLNDVDEDLKDLEMCDFSYDALCTHWLSLKGVTLLCSVSRFIELKMFMHSFRGRSLLLLVIVNTASFKFLLLEFIIYTELNGGRYEMDAIIFEVLTHRWSVMTSPWGVIKMKKKTMPTEVIEEEVTKETTTIGVLEIGMTVNKEMTTEIPNLEKTILLIHQHPKRSSTSLTLKKPCENLWLLKNRRMTSSKINSSTLKPKLSKDKRITKQRFKTFRQGLVDTLTNVPLDPIVHFQHVNAVFIRSGKTYDPPVNPNAKTTVIQDDSEDEANEAEKEVEPPSSKQAKADPQPVKAYKPKIPYPQLLCKENMEERYAKFIDLIKEVRINVPLVDVLVGMPNYGKFLKDLMSNKSKMEQIPAAFLNEECFAIVQNKLLPKLEGIVLGHKVYSARLEVDKEKINVIAKLPPLTKFKDLRSFLRHAGFTILLLQEFDIEIKNKKGAENVMANHLSRFENLNHKELRDEDIDDNFPDETLMDVSSNDEGSTSSFFDFANYLVGKILRKGLTYAQRCKFFSELKHYFWDDPYLFKMGQVKNTNRALKRILEKMVKDNPSVWSRKLDDALWAFHTTYKMPIGTTPYPLSYEKPYHLPFKINHAYWAFRSCNLDLSIAREKQFLQLHELEELRL